MFKAVIILCGLVGSMAFASPLLRAEDLVPPSVDSLAVNAPGEIQQVRVTSIAAVPVCDTCRELLQNRNTVPAAITVTTSGKTHK